MLVKKLELYNFRQFIGKQVVNFAIDNEKNITIIMGENGSGKTTLAQAFLWVLYGQTEFKIKEVINRTVRDNMTPGQEQIVKVNLYINHNNTDYIISKSQSYKRDYSGIKVDNPELIISYNKDGQQEFMKTHESLSLIKTMLPQELSKFFFFDGERIKLMSDEIEKGKSNEFADAVKGLVGLTAIMNAINHLKSSSTSSTVIGRYNNKIDEGGNEKIAQYSKDIKLYDEQLDTIDTRLDELDSQIDYYRNQSIKLNQEIASYAESEQLQAEYNKVTNEISKLSSVKKESVKALFSFFNQHSHAFFSKPLISKALSELSNADKLDKGIPDMHQKTIDFLIKRGYCICGTKLEPGTDAFAEICKVVEYLPPKSIGTLIGQFVSESELIAKDSDNYFEHFFAFFKPIKKIDEEMEEKIALQAQINKSLLVDTTRKIAELKTMQIDAEHKVSQFTNEQKTLLGNKGVISEKKERREAERNNLILVDEKNKEYEQYRQYAITVYEELLNVYKLEESINRDELQKNINDIFKEIYEGGISITIDEKYNIRVRVNGSVSKDDLERSTAQNYSVIFAFIAGIIKMAKQKSAEKSTGFIQDETIFNEAAGYPLVMDAPLSAFDKKRIKNICSTLPEIAQQIIFFIKDTDGEVAEEHLGNRIGSKYLVKKLSLVESEIISR